MLQRYGELLHSIVGYFRKQEMNQACNTRTFCLVLYILLTVSVQVPFCLPLIPSAGSSIEKLSSMVDVSLARTSIYS